VERRRLVLLFPVDDLLGWTLAAVLAPAPTWDVRRLCPAGSAADVLQALTALDPDDVIGPHDDRALSGVLLRWLALARPGARLVTLSMTTNVVEFYQKHAFSLRAAADLRCLLDTAAAGPAHKEVG
jgi:hypothetical protein